MKISTKRVYEAADKDDGYRVLVDRLWPRGVKKDELTLDEWCKDIAPSNELRQKFHKGRLSFKEFSVLYKKELKNSNVPQVLLKRVKASALTILYAAKDERHNHAQILADYLKSQL